MALRFVLDRIENNEICTVGNFYAYDGEECFFKSVAIENPIIGPEAQKDYAIPAGEYTVSKRYSPKFSMTIINKDNKSEVEKYPNGREFLWVYNEIVGKDRYILIHHGNYEKDTEGCILLGTEIIRNEQGKAWMVNSSKPKVRKLLDLLEGKSLEGATLTITNKF